MERGVLMLCCCVTALLAGVISFKLLFMIMEASDAFWSLWALIELVSGCVVMVCTMQLWGWGARFIIPIAVYL